MDKKEFVFPGIILGVVIIIAIGLLATHSSKPTLIPDSTVATSTASSTAPTTTAPGGSASAAPSRPSSSGPASYYPYGSVTLSMNQVAGFKDGLSIRPVAILEDSRCPAEVQCIQAGTVRISLKADMNGTDSTHELALGKSVTVGGDTISLVSVEPARSKNGAPSSAEYRFTLKVMRGGAAAAPGPCYVGGCSSEICSDTQGMVSTCMYRSDYACYKGATCERQSNGSCGWTQTTELKSCLANPPTL